MQNVHLTPPTIARLLGVNESTVKRWIDQGILGAERTAGGHRRVTHEHLRAFTEARGKAMQRSYALSRVTRLDPSDAWRRYFSLHLARAGTEARQYLTARYLTTGSVVQTLSEVVVPTLVAIGEGWTKGELDITDEHRMSFLIRSDLITLEALLPVPPARARTILLACVPHENHELALIMLALVAREARWRSSVLGINVPVAELARSMEQEHVDAIGLAKLYSKSLGAPYVAEALTLAGTTPIIVGGSGWSTQERSILQKKGVHVLDSLEEFRSALTAPTYTSHRGHVRTSNKALS